MKIFVIWSVSLCFMIAGAIPLESDDVNLTEELLNVLRARQSNMADTGSYDDGMEEDVLDRKSLITQLIERMTDKDTFNKFIDKTFTPEVADYIFDALKDLPQFVRQVLVDSNEQDFACQLAKAKRPNWLRTLKTVFPEITARANQLCKASILTSCSAVYDQVGAVSGEYILTNERGELYTVHCEFHSDRFYTFIAPTSLQSLPISDLYNNTKEVLVRYRLKNGTQQESTIGQISRYSERDISIQYNASLGYNPIRNTQMSPYIYMGLLPVQGINHRGARQGYSVNGVDRVFTNCDGNPNSYFAVLFNAADAKPTPYSVDRVLMRHWIGDATPVEASRYLPENYFSFFEMHLGGCGGYLTLADVPDMAGVALGLESKISSA